jgi:type IV secretory pathway TrbD component
MRRLCDDAFLTAGVVMKLPVKIRRDWHYYAFAIGLIFILNGVVGLLGFEAKGWQTYAVGLVTWVISFWLAGLIIRRRPDDEETADKPE